MAMCPECFQEKPLLANRCPHCIQEIPLGWQIGSNLIYGTTALVGFAFIFFVLWLIFG